MERCLRREDVTAASTFGTRDPVAQAVIWMLTLRTGRYKGWWFCVACCSVFEFDQSLFRSHQVGCGTPTGGKGKRRAWTGQGCVSGANSVTGLAFQEENTLISCGAGERIVLAFTINLMT